MYSYGFEPTVQIIINNYSHTSIKTHISKAKINSFEGNAPLDY